MQDLNMVLLFPFVVRKDTWLISCSDWQLKTCWTHRSNRKFIWFDKSLHLSTGSRTSPATYQRNAQTQMSDFLRNHSKQHWLMLVETPWTTTQHVSTGTQRRHGELRREFTCIGLRVEKDLAGRGGGQSWLVSPTAMISWYQRSKSSLGTRGLFLSA